MAALRILKQSLAPVSISTSHQRAIATLRLPQAQRLCYPHSMSDQDKPMKSRKEKRSPHPTGVGTPVLVRLQPDLFDWLDAARAKLVPKPSRPEMIRIYLEERRGRLIARE